MGKIVTLEQPAIDAAFHRLGIALAAQPVPTSNGTRQADADEFMWMQRFASTDHFKHRHSRRYLYLTANGGLYWTYGDGFDAA